MKGGWTINGDSEISSAMANRWDVVIIIQWVAVSGFGQIRGTVGSGKWLTKCPAI